MGRAERQRAGAALQKLTVSGLRTYHLSAVSPKE